MPGLQVSSSIAQAMVLGLGEVVKYRTGFWRILAQEQGRPTFVRIEDGPYVVALAFGSWCQDRCRVPLAGVE